MIFKARTGDRPAYFLTRDLGDRTLRSNRRTGRRRGRSEPSREFTPTTINIEYATKRQPQLVQCGLGVDQLRRMDIGDEAGLEF